MADQPLRGFLGHHVLGAVGRRSHRCARSSGPGRAAALRTGLHFTGKHVGRRLAADGHPVHVPDFRVPAPVVPLRVAQAGKRRR